MTNYNFITHNLSTEQACQLMVNALMYSFDHAYMLHAIDGETETMILITHDIVAAGTSNMSEAVVNAHRKVIKTACAAVDAGVPHAAAHESMRASLTQQAQELLAHEEKKQRPRRQRRRRS